MNETIGQAIKNLRLSMDISQETLAKALGVSTQAISKWENRKALPDITLLPAIADFFHVSIDSLFRGSCVDESRLPDNIRDELSVNRNGWDGIVSNDWGGTLLPSWGVFIPDEEKLQLFGELSGKNVLEIACGAGQSMLYVSKDNPRELWGIDISEKQIEKAKKLLSENGLKANLFQSPMEVNPGLPEHYFDCVYSIYGIGWTHDLDRTISLVAKYLKPNGTFIFSWDNPMLPCIDTINGQYVLNRSYVDEPVVRIKKRGEPVVIKYWKLSSYINCLAKYGFKVEQLIEESSEISDDVVFTDKYYSEHKAQFIHHTFVIKARKL